MPTGTGTSSPSQLSRPLNTVTDVKKKLFLQSILIYAVGTRESDRRILMRKYACCLQSWGRRAWSIDSDRPKAAHDER